MCLLSVLSIPFTRTGVLFAEAPRYQLVRKEPPCQGGQTMPPGKKRNGHGKRGRFGKGLEGSAAQAESFDELLVALLVGLLEVIEQLAALRHQLQEATPGGGILGVGRRWSVRCLILTVMRATWKSALPVSFSWTL